MQKVKSDKNRILNTLRRLPVDRVPNYEVLICARNTQHFLKCDKAVSSWELRPDEHLKLVQNLGQDVVCVPVVDYTMINPNDDGGRLYEGNISDRNVLRNVKPWSYDEHIAPAVERIKQYKKVAKGSGVGICACVSALVYDRTVYALGFENFMLQLYTDPLFIEEVMEMYASYNVALVQALCSCEVDMIHAGDDVAHKTGTFISPDTMRRLWLGRMERIVAPACQADIPFVYHSDGRLNDVLPMLLELGVAGVNPIEPYSNDIFELKAIYGDDIVLIGNVDINLLSNGTTEQVRADVRQKLEDLMPRGGYIASSSHSVVDTVQPENYLAMIETVHEFGRY